MSWNDGPVVADGWGANEGPTGVTADGGNAWGDGGNFDNKADTNGAANEDYGENDGGGRDCYNCGETG